jgi:hypothetical protein
MHVHVDKDDNNSRFARKTVFFAEEVQKIVIDLGYLHRNLICLWVICIEISI